MLCYVLQAGGITKSLYAYISNIKQSKCWNRTRPTASLFHCFQEIALLAILLNKSIFRNALFSVNQLQASFCLLWMQTVAFWSTLFCCEGSLHANDQRVVRFLTRPCYACFTGERSVRTGICMTRQDFPNNIPTCPSDAKFRWLMSSSILIY